MHVPQHRWRPRRRIAVAASAAVAVAVAVTIGALVLAPTASAATNVLVKGVGSGRCLTPPPPNNTTNATIQNCANQLWSTTSAQEITINGKCLDAKGEQTGNGTIVTIFSCHGSTNQQWRLVATTGGGSTPTAPPTPTVTPTPTSTPTRTSTPTPTATTTSPGGAETIGGGTLASPAIGPGPAFGAYGNGFTLVKNWNFGSGGTIRNIADMNSEFVYHDQFGTIGNGTNYGAITLAPDSANAISGQPVQNPNSPVRQFTGDSLKTSLDPVGGTGTTNYSNWGNGMASHGINSFNATQYHTWALLYRTNDTYSFFVDGVEVQSGTMNWTLGGGASGTPIDFHFLFDAGWGHTQVASVNHSMPASELAGTFYEFDYSRVYLR